MVLLCDTTMTRGTFISFVHLTPICGPFNVPDPFIVVAAPTFTIRLECYPVITV